MLSEEAGVQGESHPTVRYEKNERIIKGQKERASWSPLIIFLFLLKGEKYGTQVSEKLIILLNEANIKPFN